MSIHSMTGFANAAGGERRPPHINLDIRAVNHRYWTCNSKCPMICATWKALCAKPVAGKAARGKIECRIQVQSLEAARGRQAGGEFGIGAPTGLVQPANGASNMKGFGQARRGRYLEISRRAHKPERR